MTDRSQLVLNGFLQLSDAEKAEVVREINRYYNGDSSDRATFAQENLKATKRLLGPTGTGSSDGVCSCCLRPL